MPDESGEWRLRVLTDRLPGPPGAEHATGLAGGVPVEHDGKSWVALQLHETGELLLLPPDTALRLAWEFRRSAASAEYLNEARAGRHPISEKTREGAAVVAMVAACALLVWLFAVASPRSAEPVGVPVGLCLVWCVLSGAILFGYAVYRILGGRLHA